MFVLLKLFLCNVEFFLSSESRYHSYGIQLEKFDKKSHIFVLYESKRKFVFNFVWSKIFVINCDFKKALDPSPKQVLIQQYE